MRKIMVVVLLVRQLQHGFTKNAKVSPNLTVAHWDAIYDILLCEGKEEVGETGAIVTRRNCNKTAINRITYQKTTLFAQCMRYVNLNIVCKK